jgi:hypothetical protein
VRDNHTSVRCDGCQPWHIKKGGTWFCQTRAAGRSMTIYENNMNRGIKKGLSHQTEMFHLNTPTRQTNKPQVVDMEGRMIAPSQ